MPPFQLISLKKAVHLPPAYSGSSPRGKSKSPRLKDQSLPYTWEAPCFWLVFLRPGLQCPGCKTLWQVRPRHSFTGLFPEWGPGAHTSGNSLSGREG